MTIVTPPNPTQTEEAPPAAAPGTVTFHSAALRKDVPSERILRFRTATEIAATTPVEVPWIAKPWVAVGAITEVIGQPKAAGKTTWVLRMVRAVLNGEDFMGEPTTAGPVVYLTEERDSTFRAALRRAGLLDRDNLHVLQWHDTVGTPWRAVVAGGVQKCKQVGGRVLVVDTFPQFAGLPGDSENNSGDGLEAYKVLQEAVAEGIAVLCIRHERKSGGDVARAGRGSNATAGAADIILAVRRPDGQAKKTLRIISALSRFEETPDELTVELTEHGYQRRDSAAVAKDDAKIALLAAAPVGEDAAVPFEELRQRTRKIAKTTAQEAVAELVRDGQLQQLGKGVKNDPHRFFRPQIHSAGTSSYRAAETIGPRLVRSGPGIHSAGTPSPRAAERIDQRLVGGEEVA